YLLCPCGIRKCNAHYQYTQDENTDVFIKKENFFLHFVDSYFRLFTSRCAPISSAMRLSDGLQSSRGTTASIITIPLPAKASFKALPNAPLVSARTPLP